VSEVICEAGTIEILSSPSAMYASGSTPPYLHEIISEYARHATSPPS